MTKEILIKFLNNRCSKTELEEVIYWANTEALNREGKKWAFENWNNYREKEFFGEDEKFNDLFDKIQHKIENDSKKHQNTEIRKPVFSLVVTWMTRVAAILLIPVLAFLFYTLSESKTELHTATNHVIDSLEVVAPIGSRTTVYLSDGSEVHLNYGSKIKYPQFFSGDTRSVRLIGEGYFNVAHNPDKPFVVKAGKLNVKAIGTVFNVLAYPGEEMVATTLVSGKVLLEQAGYNMETTTIGTMKPGQHVNYHVKTGRVSSSMGSIEKYIAWKDGKLVFEDASISQVAEHLSRMFNVDIDVADDIKDYIYTVTFIDEPLFQILELMTIATPVSYKALPRKKLPDGTFSKQKIIISKKR